MIMSVHNCEGFVGESVESVLGQTMGDFEFLVMDDASTDGTRDILQSYSDQDKRVKVLTNQENKGLTRSLNSLIDVAAGEVLARIDADDISKKDRLERQSALLKEGDFGMVASCYRVVDKEGKEAYSHCPSCNPSLLKWSLIFRNNIRHSTAMWRRSIGQKYDTRFTYAQDYDMWCRMARSHSIGVLPEMCSDIRVHDSAITNTKYAAQDEAAAQITLEQVEHYTGRRVSLGESKDLRLVYYLKDGAQFDQLNVMSSGRLIRAIELYLEVLDRFSKKEAALEQDLLPEVANDINSLMGREDKREYVAMGMKNWFGDRSYLEKFMTSVQERFVSMN